MRCEYIVFQKFVCLQIVEAQVPTDIRSTRDDDVAIAGCGYWTPEARQRDDRKLSEEMSRVRLQ